MKYSTLCDDFKELLLDDSDFLNKILNENDVDASDGAHIFFGTVVIPYLELLLEKDDEKKIKKIFDFFEKMACSGEKEICEVLEFTIIEDMLSQNKDFLKKCKTYMGKEMLKSCNIIETYMIIEE